MTTQGPLAAGAFLRAVPRPLLTSQVPLSLIARADDVID